MRKPFRRALSRPQLTQDQIPAPMASQIVLRKVDELRDFPNNPRKHPESQINGLMRAIKRGWTNPILIDENGTILAGHARRTVAKRLGLIDVPTLTLSGLSEADKRAIVIADNKLPEKAVWDLPFLAGHLKQLIEIDYDVELTGFSTGEVDIMLDAPNENDANDPADFIDAALPNGPVVSRPCDVWECGRHKLYCGDALLAESYRRLLVDERAQMVLTDVPYNVPINGHARGRGRVRHREFAMASGEMSEAQFLIFLETAVSRAIAFSENGSIHYWFIDWRHLYELQRVGRNLYSEFKNLLVWNKTNAGQGSFYRSKHELIDDLAGVDSEPGVLEFLAERLSPSDFATFKRLLRGENSGNRATAMDERLHGYGDPEDFYSRFPVARRIGVA